VVSPGPDPTTPAALSPAAQSVQRRVQQAAELDRRLMSGEFDARPAAVIQIVDRLLAELIG